MVVITIGGLPGSGTTTIAKLLHNILYKRLCLKYVYTGDIFRNMAKEHGMTLSEFGEYVDKHPEIDRELDRRQVELARADNVILEGRVSGWIIKKNGIEAIAVWLDAPIEVRVQRVSNREKKPIELILKDTIAREASESNRYIDIYGYDMNDMSFYDLVIDTSALTPEEISAIIVREVG